MDWLKRHWFWLTVAAIGIWWFFTGDTPVNIITNIIGRGRRLGTQTQDENGDGIENVDDLVAGAAAILGRPVARDAYILASVSASEHAAAGAKEKACMQRICMNTAASTGNSLEFTITSGKGLGHQTGRYCSTVNGPWEDDLKLAEANLAGTQADDSLGSHHWVHKTGFHTLTDYNDLCAKWYAESKIVPVDIGGVSSLRIFLPEDQVQNG